MIHPAHLTTEKRISFRIINHNIEGTTDDFEMNALFESITNLFLYAYLLGHFAMRQTELRLAMRLGHSVLLFHYNKKATVIIYDV